LTNFFSLSGRCRVVNVTEEISVEEVFAAAEKAVRSEFVIFSGLPFSRVEDEAKKVPGHVVSLSDLVELGKKGANDELSSEELLQLLIEYSRLHPSPRYNLVNFPRNAADAALFLDVIGEPKAAFYLPVEDQVLSERAAEQEDFDAEKFEETLKELTGVINDLVSHMGKYYTNIQANDDIARLLLPSVYILVAPGRTFSQKVSEVICRQSKSRMSRVDVEELTKTLDTPRDRLFQETFSNSVASCFFLNNIDAGAGLSLRDQLDYLEKVSQVKGFIHCSFGREEENGEIRSTPSVEKLGENISTVRQAHAIMEYVQQAYSADIAVWTAETSEYDSIDEAARDVDRVFQERFG